MGKAGRKSLLCQRRLVSLSTRASGGKEDYLFLSLCLVGKRRRRRRRRKWINLLPIFAGWREQKREGMVVGMWTCLLQRRKRGEEGRLERTVRNLTKKKSWGEEKSFFFREKTSFNFGRRGKTRS